MPLRGCSGGLLATAALVFLALPVQYYLPNYSGPKEVLRVEPLLADPIPESPDYFQWISREQLPLFDLCLTVFLVLLATITYLCDWIQRKLLERRIRKLNQYLNESVERLRAWDRRQEQLEGTLALARGAAAEYNMLLLLLLRQRRALKPDRCFYDKDLDDFDYRTEV